MNTGAIAVIAGILAVLLAIVHLWAKNLRFLHVVPRSRWLSFGSGVSVAYVFIHVLPELGEQQVSLQAAVSTQLRFLEHHVYLIALGRVDISSEPDVHCP